MAIQKQKMKFGLIKMDLELSELRRQNDNVTKKITLKTDAEIELPSSKSISNRLLIIQALSNSNVELTNVSKAKDTVELLKCLSSQERIIHAGEGGTTVRFLVAYFL